MKRQKFSRSKTWEANESSGLIQKEDDRKWERLVSCRLDRTDQKKKEYFNLSYFVRPGSPDLDRKAVLFCSGGPGELVQHNSNVDATPATFLSSNQYDVVAFDLRGVGFSQFPPSADFDKYLRTDLAVDDLEEIRRDWLGNDKRGRAIPWEGIIAKSYGTLLAQQYANRYPTMVKKLVLLAPISRHMFKETTDAYETFVKDSVRIQRECLLRIYNSKEEAFLAEFGDLTDRQKETILNKLFGNPRRRNKKGIVQQIDETFGNSQYVIDEYFRLKHGGVLEDYGLERFSRSFFKALRELRLVGAITTKAHRDTPIRIGRVLRDNILGKPEIGSETLEKNMQLHYRVLYGMWIHDGLDPKFLRALRTNGGNVRSALTAIGGKVHIDRKLNRWLKKVQIDDRLNIKPWDPADYSHNVDTLILKGEADPVTCLDQVERWYSDGLKGRRVFITLPDVGHDMLIPVGGEVQEGIPEKKEKSDSILSGVIRVKALNIQPGEIRATIGTANGLRLNKNLHFTINPARLKNRVRIQGAGIVLNQRSDDINEVPDQIVIVMRNIGNEYLGMLEIKDTLLPIECTFFSGLVQIERVETIPPEAVKPVYGTVVQAKWNETRICKLQISQDPDELPGLLGFSIDGPNVSLYFVNNSQKIFSAKTINCRLSRGSLARKFRARIPDLQVGEAQDTSPVTLLEFGLENEEEFNVVFPGEEGEGLIAEIPQEATSHLIPIIIWNNRDAPFTRRSMTLLIENTAFSLTVDTALDKDIAVGGAVKVYATVRRIKWKKWLDVQDPHDLERGLKFVGYNILSKNRILMLLKNENATVLKSSSHDWIYFDPREQGNGEGAERAPVVLQAANGFEDRKPLLNRLLYSFLVRDIQEFSNEDHNRVLKQVHDVFRSVGLDFKSPLYSNG